MSIVKLASLSKKVEDANIRLNNKYIKPFSAIKWQKLDLLHLETNNKLKQIKDRHQRHDEILFNTFKRIHAIDSVKSNKLHPKLMLLIDKHRDSYSKNMDAIFDFQDQQHKALNQLEDLNNAHVRKIYDRYKKHYKYIQNRNIKRGIIGAGLTGLAIAGGVALHHQSQKVRQNESR